MRLSTHPTGRSSAVTSEIQDDFLRLRCADEDLRLLGAEVALRLRAELLCVRREVLGLLCRVVPVAFLPSMARELSRLPRAPTCDLPSFSC